MPTHLKAQRLSTLKMIHGQERVIIESVIPQVDGGFFPIKRVVGEKVVVQADIFTDGNDYIMAYLLFRRASEKDWRRIPMRYLENDRWEGVFWIETEEDYYYTLEGWVDTFKTWQKALLKKFEADEDIDQELIFGIEYLEKLIYRKKDENAEKIHKFIKKLRELKQNPEAVRWAINEELLSLARNYPNEKSLMSYRKVLQVHVDRPKALFSTWYEFFPRSFGFNGAHGTFKDCVGLLPEIARMGFDVIYLPPIHPIGYAKRKGKNNAKVSLEEDPGSPWAVGSDSGGHFAVHPQLGTISDFVQFIHNAKSFGIEIAMDLPLQCSLDHPYVREHPEWFKWRSDGTVQYVETPPFKFEDVVAFNFSSEEWPALWAELKNIVVFWIKKGVKIFRVDSPHTKPFIFWKWLIAQIRREYPDVIFLAATFTRPRVMQQLAKLGFSQSYTHFNWRATKWELSQYLTELTQTPMREYCRPNFWPNTHDVLPFHLQHGGRPAFIIRLVLAATLSSNYGIYGPPFELCVAEALEAKEEYFNSEKYEIKHWEWNQSGNLKDLLAHINLIRRQNLALQAPWNVRFCDVDNVNLLSYYKATEDLSNILFMVVNLDPFHPQSGWVKVPLNKLGINFEQPYRMIDLITNEEYLWQGEWNYVELNPHIFPVHILKVQRM